MFKPDGADAELDDQIAELRTVLALTQLSTPVLARVAEELSGLLRRRADRDDDDAPVDEALLAVEHALRLIPADDPNRAGVELERALTLELRYRRRGVPSDLHAAIGIWATLTNSDVFTRLHRWLRAEAVARLGSLQRLRLGLLVETADDDTIDAALLETQRTLQAAQDALAPDSPMLAETCWLLGLCWGDRYARERDARHLDAAIAAVSRTVKLAPDPSGDRHLALARALHERALLCQDAGRAGSALSDLRAATDQAQAALDAVHPTDPLRIEVLWTAVTIAVTHREASPETMDLALAQAWADQLLAHYDQTDPYRATDDARAADGVRAAMIEGR